MTPVHTVKNQYVGINAHLHSLLQSGSGWDSFHANHIADLTRSLQVQLRPLGYEADIEQSLQIRRVSESSHYPESDATIFDTDPIRPFSQHSRASTAPQELILTIPTLLNLTEEQISYYKSIGLYHYTPGQKRQGEPVGWIELLSPSNKPGGRNFENYAAKRTMILQTGIVFIEIDYLHQSPATFAGIAPYSPLSEEGYPYRITVIEPRPDFFTGQGRSWQFHVDDPIPTMTIPLSGDDKIEFDFGAPYAKTFEEMFYGDRVDYNLLPVDFDLYNHVDKTRIVNRMLAVREAEERDSPPLSVPSLSLKEALEKLNL